MHDIVSPFVMAGLEPAIQACPGKQRRRGSWIIGSDPPIKSADGNDEQGGSGRAHNRSMKEIHSE